METFSALLAICLGNSPHKVQWRGALMFSLICAWINDWLNSGKAGDLRRYRVFYDVTVMILLYAVTITHDVLHKNMLIVFRLLFLGRLKIQFVLMRIPLIVTSVSLVLRLTKDWPSDGEVLCKGNGQHEKAQNSWASLYLYIQLIGNIPYMM